MASPELPWTALLRPPDGHSTPPRLGNAKERYQRTTSKNDIEKNLEHNCKHFAYPDGSYNNQASIIVEECGYESAVTTREGLNAAGCNLFQLTRISIPIDVDKIDILARVSGLSHSITNVISVFKRSK